MKNDTIERQFIYYTIVLAIGNATLGLLTLYKNIKIFGIFGFERIMPDFWTGEYSGATSQSALFLLLGGLFFYVMVIIKRQPLLKLTFLVGIVILVFNGMLFSSRTAIVYPAIALFVSYLSYIFFTKNFHLRTLFIIGAIAFILFVIFRSNLWSINSFANELPLINRLNQTYYTSLIEDTRFGSYSFFIRKWAYYPFGGLNSINPIKYMHNLWLDAYAVSGIIPFIFLILFSIGVLKNIIKLIKHIYVDYGFKIFLIGTYSSYFLLFMSEPVLLASPWFFITFCITVGMTDKYLESISNKDFRFS